MNAGRVPRFRPICVHDAEAFIALNVLLAGEPLASLLTPEEASVTLDAERRLLDRMADSNLRTVIVAEFDAQLAGYVGCVRGPHARNRHGAGVVLGVAPPFRRQGVATALLGEVEAWARRMGITRLELSVAAGNEVACRLYLRAGYCCEGLKKASLRVDTGFADELLMAKLLPTAAGSALRGDVP